MPAETIERSKDRLIKSRAQQEHTINFRVSTRTRDRIDAAAEILGKTRTQFVLETAERAATDVLLDQRLFELSEEAFNAFNTALEAPPAANDQLRRLLKEKAPWEK